MWLFDTSWWGRCSPWCTIVRDRMQTVIEFVVYRRTNVFYHITFSISTLNRSQYNAGFFLGFGFFVVFVFLVLVVFLCRCAGRVGVNRIRIVAWWTTLKTAMWTSWRTVWRTARSTTFLFSALRFVVTLRNSGILGGRWRISIWRRQRRRCANGKSTFYRCYFWLQSLYSGT